MLKPDDSLKLSLTDPGHGNESFETHDEQRRNCCVKAQSAPGFYEMMGKN